MTVGCYPGSFDPPTVAHLAIVRAALHQLDLDRIVLCLSRTALAKSTGHAPLDLRVAALEASLHDVPAAGVAVTEHQLIADIAADFDAVVMGADKWQQINDPVFYDGDPSRARLAVASLPRVAVVARPPATLPPGAELVIDEPHLTTGVSSTLARAGDAGLMTEAARRIAETTGYWR